VTILSVDRCVRVARGRKDTLIPLGRAPSRLSVTVRPLPCVMRMAYAALPPETTDRVAGATRIDSDPADDWLDCTNATATPATQERAPSTASAIIPLRRCVAVIPAYELESVRVNVAPLHAS